MGRLVGEISISENASDIIKNKVIGNDGKKKYFVNESDFGRFALAYAINKELDVNFDYAKYKSSNSLKTKWHYASIDPDGVYHTILVNLHPDIEINNDYISCLIDYTIKFIDDNYFSKNIELYSEILA